jgi:hypothetical protein
VSGANRTTAITLGALWPAGVLLAVAHQEIDQMTTPVYLVLAAGYLGAAIVLGRRLRAHRRGSIGMLAATPIALFGLAGYSGEPTGASPDLLVINTAVLLAVAVELALTGWDLVLKHRRSPAAGFAAVTMVLLLLGSSGYLVNLFGRFAVVLTGLSERQAVLEDEYWVAAEYLRGLPADPDPLSYLLTWMDLVQLGYVATAYVAAAGLARLLRTEGVVGPRAGRVVERSAWAATGLLVGSVALAMALPRDLDAVPAGLAFALGIPFMTTGLPFALAVCALWTARSTGTPRSADSERLHFVGS